MKKILFAILVISSLVLGFWSPTRAQELHRDEQAVWRAEVVGISDVSVETQPWTNLVSHRQTVTALLINGERKGDTLSFTNDFVQLEEGDKFFLVYTKTVDGMERFAVQETDRTLPLIILALIFIFAVVALSGLQGVRSLVGLVVSVSMVLVVLLPLLLKGYPPVITTVLVAGAILVFAIVFTHGWNMRSLVALVGTWSAVIVTGILSHLFIGFTKLTGFASDESIYLNVSTQGALDFTGLLLAAIIIGVLGVLDDIAITQVAVVGELSEHDPSIAPRELYRKALRVGKEHVGALVNTLVFAYAGASLPLLLVFYQTDAAMITLINQEVLTTEIVRALVGSIGLILTVPITTALAVLVRTRLKGGEAHHHHHH